MSLGAMLDVGIGMIFVFLLLGLIVSALQEAVASLFALRGKYLLEGIATILADGKRERWMARAHILPWSSTDRDKGSELFKSVSTHALIKDITPSDTPSYVPAANFALALIDTLRKGSAGTVAEDAEGSIASLPDGPAKEALSALFVDAKGDIDVFQKRIETWFDGAMDRVSGVYKRWTQYFALAAGVVIAVALNVSSISVAERLWNDPTLRDAAVRAAEAFAAYCDAEPRPTDCPKPTEASDAQPAPAASDPAQETTQPPPDQGTTNTAQATAEKMQETKATYEEVQKQMMAIGYPIGWTESPRNWTSTQWMTAILGWLITGIAVSLGAPFWFGMLKTFLNIRGAGPNPAEKAQGK
jgi:hypothetical protein